LKNRIVLFSLIVVLLSSLLAIGCAAEPPKPGEVIQLKYASQNPETGFGPINADKPYLAQLEKATNGKLKITPYFAQSLNKGPDQWQALKSGIADLAWCFHGYWPTMTPLAEVITLPFLPFKSAEQASEILWKLTEKYPNMSKQWSENKLLLTFVTSPYFIETTKKQIKTMDDLKGMKFRVAGSNAVEAAKLLGIVPQTMPMPDSYENLQKGVVDGILSPWESLYTFKLYEVARYWTMVPFHTGYFSIAMNLDVWNKLGPDVQKQVMSVSGLAGSKFWGKKFFDEAEATARAEIKKTNIPITEYTLPKEELAKWQDVAGKPVWDKWIADMKAKGWPEAQNILNDLLDWAK
jgi:TRAP-type C4-dicarboxylate transport system substrate-binding protein